MEASSTSSELELKVLLVGAPKSGKTSLVRRMLDKTFREEYVQTLGFDIAVVPFGTYQGRPVKLHLWDVAGSQLHAQPCHHALIGQGAEGVMYVMDVTSRESLQAVDDWDQALSKFLPPWTCKLLVGHKADLPAYVVNDEALSLYVDGASGFKGWCLTVGSSEYGDYDVAARRGAGGTAAGGGGRYNYKGKSMNLSGEKQLSVSEAVRTLLGHVFRSGGAGGGAMRPAGVLGLGASTGRATPLPSESLDDALSTVELLGFGVEREKVDRSGAGEDAESAKRSGERFAEGMEALLERGTGPDSSWRAGGAGQGDSAAEGYDAAEVEGADLGWRYFAGRMGREEAEALLRGRPDGTFFLRRKGPSLLVLTYVALSKRGRAGAETPGSGGKHRSKASPASRASSSSPSPPSRRRDVFGSPLGRDASTRSGKDYLADNTSVQHALLVYKEGFFSDERGRLGKFGTIQELLKSKISALARYPLSFRREGDRYVLVDDGEQDPSTPAGYHGNTSGKSALLPSSNPFATAGDDNTVLTVRGSTATSLVPAMTGDLFGAGGTREPGASPSSSPPGVDKAAATNSFEQGLRDRRSLGAAGGGTRRVSGDWADSRTSGGKAKRRGEPAVAKSGGLSFSSSAGGGWLEAAAAAEEAGAVAAGGADVKNASGLWIRGRSPPSGGGAVATGSTLYGTAAAGRRVSADSGPRKGSVSSADSGSVVSSPSMRADALGVGGSKAQQRQNQQRRRGGGGGGGQATSAMEAAAEVAAAMASARDHPDARQVEERTLAAQAMTDSAVKVLEQQLRPVIKRKSPAHSPRQSPSGYSPASSPPSADMRGGRRVSLSSPLSSFSSPRDSPRTPESFAPQPSGEEQQLRWAAAVPEGSATAPLVAAATLLMERAWSRRQDLVVSIRKLRERAVALAVAEASSGGGIPAVAATSRIGGGGSSGGFGTAGVPPENINIVDVNGSGSDGSRSQPAPLSTRPPIPEAEETKKTVAAAPADTGGLAGLSCCLDFERILGDEGEALPPDETTSFAGVHGVAVTGSSAFRDGFSVDKRKPLSDSSTLAERSFSGMDQQSGGSEISPITRAGAEAALGPAQDEWQAVFRDVLIAEERGRALVKGWEAAGGALKHTCEDLAFGEIDRNLVGGGAAQ